MSTSEQSHVLKAGAPTGDPQQYVAYEIQEFFQATDPIGVGAVGQQYQQNGSFALLVASDLDGQGKTLFDQWQGPAAEVAQQALAQLRNTAQRFGEACTQFGTALDDYGSKLGTYKNVSWPLLSQDEPPKPGQMAALNVAAQQAMAQANGDMAAAWSAMPNPVVSELPGISSGQSGTTSPGGGPGATSYSAPSGGRTGSDPSQGGHQPGSVPPGTTTHLPGSTGTPPGTGHQPGSTTTTPPPPGTGKPGSTTPPGPTHLSSAPPPPGTTPGPGASTPPPGSSPGFPTPGPGTPGSPTPGPLPSPVGPVLSSTPPPSSEDPPPGLHEPAPLPPGEELPPPGMIRPFLPGPGADPVGSVPPGNVGRFGSNGRVGPNGATSNTEAAAASDEFAVSGANPGMPGAMTGQDEALGLSAAELGQRDMLGMPMAPMGPVGEAPQAQAQGRSANVTEGREVWSDEVEVNSPVIGDAPNYLGLTGRRPVRPEPGDRLSTVELERLLHEAVADPGDQTRREPARIPGEISSLLDGVDAGAPLPDGMIRS